MDILSINIEQIEDTIRNERACVLKADKGCDRQCGSCPLVRPTDEILNAYNAVLSILGDIRHELDDAK